ncbi:MAG: hypothetical protein KZQ83_18810 [gamma proteobacterium symbiont of Taylorina sp.]|nr:hypothetical protein [gamma proteobacterium symbiont of Taylorina sp.]
MKGIEVNRKELANIFGVSLNTISTWTGSKDCPYVQKPDLSYSSGNHA